LAPHPDELADDRRATVLTDVVERGEAAVGLAGDDDGLAVALERQPVPRCRDLLGPTGDEPVRARTRSRSSSKRIGSV
jgi:hypothetical protein